MPSPKWKHLGGKGGGAGDNTNLGPRAEKEGLETQGVKLASWSVQFCSARPLLECSFYFESWVQDSLGSIKGLPWNCPGISFFKQICPWKMSSRAECWGSEAPGWTVVCLLCLSWIKTCPNSHRINSAVFRQADTGAGVCVLKKMHESPVHSQNNPQKRCRQISKGPEVNGRSGTHRRGLERQLASLSGSDPVSHTGRPHL